MSDILKLCTSIKRLVDRGPITLVQIASLLSAMAYTYLWLEYDNSKENQTCPYLYSVYFVRLLDMKLKYFFPVIFKIKKNLFNF